jgi:protocatechuate 3,4-dioxygenase beta subunit
MQYNRSYTTTDAQGRYRLEGVGKHKEYTIVAEGIPYFNSTKLNLPDTPSLEPITVDFELERGILIKGRLTDKATGKPVQGWVNYIALEDNPHRKDFTELGKLHAYATNWGRTAADGSFTELAIPGPGLLCAQAHDKNRFLAAEVKPDYRTNTILDSYHAVIPLNVSENDPTSTAIDIALEPGRTLAGTVVGPEGQPLAGAHAAGLSSVLVPFGFRDSKLEQADFQAGGLTPRRPRSLVFVHAEKKLAKVQPIRGDEEGPLTVRLEPLATLAGRIVGADGRPRPGLKVAVLMSVERKDYADLPLELLFDYPSWSKLTNGEATTDDAGRFRIEGLVPGLKYLLNVKDEAAILPDYTREVLALEAGQDKDLGDLKAKPSPGKE